MNTISTQVSQMTQSLELTNQSKHVSFDVSEFNLETAKNCYYSTLKFVIEFDKAWAWLGYSSERTAMIGFKSFDFIQNIDYRRLKIEQFTIDGRFSHHHHQIDLTVDCFRTWAENIKSLQGRKIAQIFRQCDQFVKTYDLGFVTTKASLILEIADKTQGTNQQDRIAAISSILSIDI